MQQRMTVLAAPQNRVGRITDRMTFKGKMWSGWYAAGEHNFRMERHEPDAGWDGMMEKRTRNRDGE